MNEQIKITEYTVNDPEEMLVNMKYRVLEMGFFEWLTIKSIMDAMLENNEHPTAEYPISVNTFIVGNDYRVWISGADVGDVMSTIRYLANDYPEFEIEEEEIEVDDFIRRYFFYNSNPDNRLLETTEIWYPSFHDVKITHNQASVDVTLRQLIALNAFASRNHNQIEILGIGDGALMLEFSGMTVGIEPDGYTHS